MTASSPPTDPYATSRAETKSLTVPMAELATALGISVAHCYELARRNALPIPVERLGDHRGARYLILRTDFDRYFGRTVAPAPTPITLVAQERSAPDKALAAIDRRIADHENEIALWQSLRSLLAEHADKQRAAS